MPRGLIVLAFAAAASLRGQIPDLNYDASAPLGIEEKVVKDYGFGKLIDLSFTSPRGGGRVPAYAVIPSRKGALPGIVWQHWGQGDRSSFLPEAFNLARRGAASIMINAPWLRPDNKPTEGAEADRDSWLNEVVELRRSADVLVQHFNVDPKRLAYVGHSYGATMGGLVAVSERRFKALVLMGGFSRYSKAVLKRDSSEKGKQWAGVVSVIDSDRYIGKAAPAALFLQFARYDRFVDEQQANRYAAAASEPKLVRWYEGGHEFNDAASTRDREEWLAKQLGLR
ncbi:MAG TPA: prolyl oligopeptidase family serine peptidase [Bryobacteraceae bacterium]|nr:prolyl oligopeptidase family serine peptidase [Bryobacteraceae bacterium]